MSKSKKKVELPVVAPSSIFQLVIKKGMRFILLEDSESTGAKRGDVVKVTSVGTIFKGVPSDGRYNDYEMIRVSNGQYSWRQSREYLLPVQEAK